MNKIYTVFFAFMCLFAIQISASHLTVKGIVDFEQTRNSRKLFTFTDNSRWFMHHSHSYWYSVGRTYFVDAENPQPENSYNFALFYNDSEMNTRRINVPAIMISNSPLEVLDETEGSLSSHQIANKFNLPGSFSVDDSIIELDDGRIWLIPTYQNTFNIGDIVSVFIENDDLVYLIKTVKVGGVEKEVLMPSKRLAEGFYQVK